MQSKRFMAVMEGILGNLDAVVLALGGLIGAKLWLNHEERKKQIEEEGKTERAARNAAARENVARAESLAMTQGFEPSATPAGDQDPMSAILSSPIAQAFITSMLQKRQEAAANSGTFQGTSSEVGKQPNQAGN